MITYVLEILVFQGVFLLVYDLMLKRESFFQWNRVYLLFTFVLSLILPYINIEALRTTVSTEVAYYPNFLWDINNGFTIYPQTLSGPTFLEVPTFYGLILAFGTIVMGIWFGLKLYNIQNLRKEGIVTYHPDFTKVVVRRSSVAFSFFKQIFVGNDIPKEKETQILAHELVHVKQWHSLDLLFFELMRVVFWFNPFVYLYQSRIAELHEFIADAVVAKTYRKEQYQALLSETFQTKNFSFINQFFKESLIKKRIVMFTIDENGEITNIEKRGPHQLLEDEVVRIIKRLPKMVPGRHNGEVVKVPFSVPVNFVLQNE